MKTVNQFLIGVIYCLAMSCAGLISTAADLDTQLMDLGTFQLVMQDCDSLHPSNPSISSDNNESYPEPVVAVDDSVSETASSDSTTTTSSSAFIKLAMDTGVTVVFNEDHTFSLTGPGGLSGTGNWQAIDGDTVRFSDENGDAPINIDIKVDEDEGNLYISAEDINYSCSSTSVPSSSSSVPEPSSSESSSETSSISIDESDDNTATVDPETPETTSLPDTDPYLPDESGGDEPSQEVAPCVVTGCSGQLCTDTDVITTCEWRDEYACYKTAKCKRQADGQCAWSINPMLYQCLSLNSTSGSQLFHTVRKSNPIIHFSVDLRSGSLHNRS